MSDIIKLKNLKYDIRTILKNNSKTNQEKFNLIYALLDNY